MSKWRIFYSNEPRKGIHYVFEMTEKISKKVLLANDEKTIKPKTINETCKSFILVYGTVAKIRLAKWKCKSFFLYEFSYETK